MGRQRGNPRLAEVRNTNTSAANAARTVAADDFAAEMFEPLRQAAVDGCASDAAQARWLTSNGYKTPWGRDWSHVAIRRLRDRLKRMAACGWRPGN